MRKPNSQCDTLILYTDFFLCTVVNIFLSRENAIDTTVYVIPVRAFDHICMEKARYKFLNYYYYYYYYYYSYLLCWPGSQPPGQVRP